MKKLIIKLLSFVICLRYCLLAKAYFSEAKDPVKIRQKLVQISKFFNLCTHISFFAQILAKCMPYTNILNKNENILC